LRLISLCCAPALDCSEAAACGLHETRRGADHVGRDSSTAGGLSSNEGDHVRDDQEGRRHAGSDHEEDLHRRDLLVPFSLVQTDDPQNPLDPPDPNPYSNFFHFMGGLKNL